MKRFLSIVLAVITVTALCFVFASAEDKNPLIPEGLAWEYTDNGGCRVDVHFEGGNAIFSGSNPGTWPEAHTYYDKPITVKVDGSKIAFHFEVAGAGGATNITFIFSSPDKSDAYYFPISCNALNAANYDTGSGDLLEGTYKGSIKLSDLINAKTNLSGEAFNKDYVTAEGTLTFAGIQVYSVSGAVITVKQLEVVGASADEPTESEEESEEVSEDESEVVSEEESEVVSEEASEEESTVSEAVSEEASEEVSGETSEGGEEEENSFPWWLIGVCGGIVVIAVIAIILASKKKKA